MKRDYGASFMNRRKALVAVAAVMLILLVVPDAKALPRIVLDALGYIIPAGLEYISGKIVDGVEYLLTLTAIFVQINPCVYSTADTCNYQVYSTMATISVPWPIYVDPGIRAINTVIMGMLQLWYIFAIVFLGAYLIFMAGSPHGRSNAKETFIRLIVGMIVVSQSPVIFQFIIDFVKFMTEELMKASGGTGVGLTSFRSADFVCGNMCFLIVAVAGMFIAAIRYVLVYAMAGLFPLTMFLYFTDIPNPFFSTRGLGTRLLRFTILLFIVQLLQVLFLAIAFTIQESSAGSFSANIWDLVFLIAAYGGVLYTPMVGMKLMAWVGAVLHLYSTRGQGDFTRFIATWMRTGRVSNALMTASGQYMIGHNMGHHAGGEAKGPSSPFRYGVADGFGKSFSAPGVPSYLKRSGYPAPRGQLPRGAMGMGVVGVAGRGGSLYNMPAFAGDAGMGAQRMAQKGAGANVSSAVEQSVHTRETVSPGSTKTTADVEASRRILRQKTTGAATISTTTPGGLRVTHQRIGKPNETGRPLRYRLPGSKVKAGGPGVSGDRSIRGVGASSTPSAGGRVQPPTAWGEKAGGPMESGAVSPSDKAAGGTPTGKPSAGPGRAAAEAARRRVSEAEAEKTGRAETARRISEEERADERTARKAAADAWKEWDELGRKGGAEAEKQTMEARAKAERETREWAKKYMALLAKERGVASRDYGRAADRVAKNFRDFHELKAGDSQASERAREFDEKFGEMAGDGSLEEPLAAKSSILGLADTHGGMEGLFKADVPEKIMSDAEIALSTGKTGDERIREIASEKGYKPEPVAVADLAERVKGRYGNIKNPGEVAAELYDAKRRLGIGGRVDDILDNDGIAHTLDRANDRTGSLQQAQVHKGLDRMLVDKMRSEGRSDQQIEGMLRQIRSERHDRAEARQRELLSGLNAAEGSRERGQALEYLRDFIHKRGRTDVTVKDLKDARFVDYSGDKEAMARLNQQGLGDTAPYAVVIPTESWYGGGRGSPGLVHKIGDGRSRWGGFNAPPMEGELVGLSVISGNVDSMLRGAAAAPADRDSISTIFHEAGHERFRIDSTESILTNEDIELRMINELNSYFVLESAAGDFRGADKIAQVLKDDYIEYYGDSMTAVQKKELAEKIDAAVEGVERLRGMMPWGTLSQVLRTTDNLDQLGSLRRLSIEQLYDYTGLDAKMSQAEEHLNAGRNMEAASILQDYSGPNETVTADSAASKLGEMKARRAELIQDETQATRVKHEAVSNVEGSLRTWGISEDAISNVSNIVDAGKADEEAGRITRLVRNARGAGVKTEEISSILKAATSYDDFRKKLDKQVREFGITSGAEVGSAANPEEEFEKQDSQDLKAMARIRAEYMREKERREKEQGEKEKAQEQKKKKKKKEDEDEGGGRLIR